MSYDAALLHMGRFQQKQQIDTVISSGLTDWLLSYGLGFSIGVWSEGSMAVQHHD